MIEDVNVAMELVFHHKVAESWACVSSEQVGVGVGFVLVCVLTELVAEGTDESMVAENRVTNGEQATASLVMEGTDEQYAESEPVLQATDVFEHKIQSRIGVDGLVLQG